MTHILIPCKHLRTGKSRLSGCLDGHARRELCAQLLTRTLQHAASVAAAAQVRVVTADPEAAAIARRHAIGHIFDHGGGLNSALDGARDAVLDETSAEDGLLILPIDLPFASPAALSKALSSTGDVVIAPDESETGTNLLLLRAASLRVFRFAYGPDSYSAHLTAARSLGLSVAVLKDQRLGFDVDSSAQYAKWVSSELNHARIGSPGDACRHTGLVAQSD
jgi:2-phospho-L-lactate guanylyltransferase